MIGEDLGNSDVKTVDENDHIPRWDCALHLNSYLYTNAKKVWVCGPPLMQEYFDRAIPLLKENIKADILIL